MNLMRRSIHNATRPQKGNKEEGREASARGPTAPRRREAREKEKMRERHELRGPSGQTWFVGQTERLKFFFRPNWEMFMTLCLEEQREEKGESWATLHQRGLFADTSFPEQHRDVQ